MFEDRATSSPNDNTTINGGGTSSFDGILYFKPGNLTFAGNNTTTDYMVLVADTIGINGHTTLGNSYSSLGCPYVFAPQSTGGGLAL